MTARTIFPLLLATAGVSSPAFAEAPITRSHAVPMDIALASSINATSDAASGSTPSPTLGQRRVSTAIARARAFHVPLVAPGRSFAVPSDVSDRSTPSSDAVRLDASAPRASARVDVASAPPIVETVRPAVRGSSLDRETRCLAQAVFHESRGEPMRGQRAVADVVVNRARSGRWGGGVCNVVNAPSQFSNRWSWRVPQVGVADWDRAISIARDAMSGAVVVSSRLMNFRAARLGAGGVAAMRIGHHVFW